MAGGMRCMARGEKGSSGLPSTNAPKLFHYMAYPPLVLGSLKRPLFLLPEAQQCSPAGPRQVMATSQPNVVQLW